MRATPFWRPTWVRRSISPWSGTRQTMPSSRWRVSLKRWSPSSSQKRGLSIGLIQSPVSRSQTRRAAVMCGYSLMVPRIRMAPSSAVSSSLYSTRSRTCLRPGTASARSLIIRISTPMRSSSTRTVAPPLTCRVCRRARPMRCSSTRKIAGAGGWRGTGATNFCRVSPILGPTPGSSSRTRSWTQV